MKILIFFCSVLISFSELSNGCKDDQFQCKSGGCISDAFRCDGIRDCLGGEDEICMCDTFADMFHCDNGMCISKNFRCDGIKTCPNGEDEINCPVNTDYNAGVPLCASYEVECDGKCYPKSILCNGIYECRDHSDEDPSYCTPHSHGIVSTTTTSPTRAYPFTQSPPTCKPNEYSCPDGSGCFKLENRCIGPCKCRDCYDKSGCYQTTPVPVIVCSPYEFKCDGVCFPNSKKCDHVRDCRDGSDEINCQDVADKLRVEVRPTYVDVYENSPVEVECLATSSTPVTYYWTRVDGKLSSDAQINGQKLTFSQVRRSDSGSYQCIARNYYAANSTVLNVYVRELIPTTQLPDHVVSIQPSRFTGRPGDNLVLTCSNAINVHATLIWNKDDLKQLPSHIIVRNGVLTIQNVRVEDSGRYICTSTPSLSDQSIESITDVAEVVITNYENGSSQSPNYPKYPNHSNHPIYVKQLEQMYKAIQSSNFSLACEASGSQYPTISWMKIHENSLGSNVQQIGNTLKISNVQPENRGIYQCIATSNGQTAETSTVIDIELREAPIVEIYPHEPQTVRVGESVLLSCRATAGYPTPTVVWSRSDRTPLSQRVKEQQAGTILISNITFAEQGEYECIASNLVGVARKMAVVHVQEPPMIRILPETTEWTITEGDEMKLECFAEGSPLPTVQWKRLNQLSNSEQIIQSVQNYSKNATTQSLIHKYNVDRSDEGTYFCHASNAAGEDQKYITILVQTKHVADNIIDSRPEQPVRPIQPDYQPDYQPNYQPNYQPEYRPNYGPNYPQTTSRPENLPKQYKVAVGSVNKISCEIDGFDKSTSWRRQDGSPLPSSSYLSGGDLVIEYTQQDAAGIYECVLHETQGDFPIVTAEIIVVELPKVELSPEMPYNVRNGEHVYITCNATGDGPIHVEWYREDRQPFPPQVRAIGNYLELFQITPANAGRYFCSAKNRNGNVTKGIDVIANHHKTPNHSAYGRVQEVLEDGSVALECTEPSAPGAKFEWRREYGNLTPNEHSSHSNHLTCVDNRSKDIGRYICRKI